MTSERLHLVYDLKIATSKWPSVLFPLSGLDDYQRWKYRATFHSHPWSHPRQSMYLCTQVLLFLLDRKTGYWKGLMVHSNTSICILSNTLSSYCNSMQSLLQAWQREACARFFGWLFPPQLLSDSSSHRDDENILLAGDTLFAGRYILKQQSIHSFATVMTFPQCHLVAGNPHLKKLKAVGTGRELLVRLTLSTVWQLWEAGFPRLRS